MNKARKAILECLKNKQLENKQIILDKINNDSNISFADYYYYTELINTLEFIEYRYTGKYQQQRIIDIINSKKGK